MRFQSCLLRPESMLEQNDPVDQRSRVLLALRTLVLEEDHHTFLEDNLVGNNRSRTYKGREEVASHEDLDTAASMQDSYWDAAAVVHALQTSLPSCHALSSAEETRIACGDGKGHE
jgi:hypothetical protein